MYNNSISKTSNGGYSTYSRDFTEKWEATDRILCNKSPWRAQFWQPWIEIKGDGDRQQLARWLFETIWNIVITTLVYVGPFCRSINLKNLFLCCIPSPTLDTIPTIPTWTCLQSFKNNIWVRRVGSWPISSRARMARARRKPTIAEKRTTRSPEDSARTDGWTDGRGSWNSQLNFDKFPKWKKSSDWLANVLMGSINKQTDAAKISIEGPLFGSFWSVPWEFQGDQDKPSLFKVQSRPWRWMGSSSGTAEACRNLQTEQSSNWHGMHFLKNWSIQSQ